MHVGAKIRVVPYSSQDGRVQHLQQQPGYASDHHRGDVAMNPPCDRAWTEQPVVAASHRLFTTGPVIEQPDHLGSNGTLDRSHDKRP